MNLSACPLFPLAKLALPYVQGSTWWPVGHRREQLIALQLTIAEHPLNGHLGRLGHHAFCYAFCHAFHYAFCFEASLCDIALS